MVDGLGKLVSEIIQELDYDLWKEIYVFTDDEGIDLRNIVSDLIEDWYDIKVRKDNG